MKIKPRPVIFTVSLKQIRRLTRSALRVTPASVSQDTAASTVVQAQSTTAPANYYDQCSLWTGRKNMFWKRRLLFLVVFFGGERISIYRLRERED